MALSGLINSKDLKVCRLTRFEATSTDEIFSYKKLRCMPSLISQKIIQR